MIISEFGEVGQLDRIYITTAGHCISMVANPNITTIIYEVFLSNHYGGILRFISENLKTAITDRIDELNSLWMQNLGIFICELGTHYAIYQTYRLLQGREFPTRSSSYMSQRMPDILRG